MSGGNVSSSDLATALEGYARLTTEQSNQTNHKIELLTASIQTLVETSIKSEARHEQYDERFERLEENGKELGKKFEQVKDTVLILNEEKVNSTKRRGAIVLVISGVISTVIAAYFVGKK